MEEGGGVLFEKLIVTQLVKTFPASLVPEGSLPCSKEPATGPYAEPLESSPYIPILYLLSILISSSHLRPGLKSGVFPTDFPVEIYSAFLL
jgi:hypothetical protein